MRFEKFNSIRTNCEFYDNPQESRKWMKRFIIEHNGKAWLRKNPKTLNAVMASTGLWWMRIKRDGRLVGYARGYTDEVNLGIASISDVYILPHARGKGLFHTVLWDVITYSRSGAICLAWDKIQAYRSDYEAIGFSWVFTAQESTIAATSGMDDLDYYLMNDDGAYAFIKSFTSGGAQIRQMSDRAMAFAFERGLLQDEQLVAFQNGVDAANDDSYQVERVRKTSK